ncbi:MAG: zf-HC2 domain-containing protein [Acidobacteria bacterium]|nr:zf-HC2 domain-containing protein [Acidobacteriota bacterium]
MTCREMTEFLADYVAGELPDGQLRTFESHIAACVDCGVFLAQYRTTIRAGIIAFQETNTTPIPEPLVAAILSAIDDEGQ